jgi:23S rRNA (cytidine2498-2'-O)-methyltransferase
MPDSPSFLLITCQIGAEKAVKSELAREWPEFRFAYSRPGFLTFKLPPDHGLADNFNLRSVFARAYAFSLGKVLGESTDDLAQQVWKLVGDLPVEQIHVWQRDAYAPGDHSFQPGPTPLAHEVEIALRQHDPVQLAGGQRGTGLPTRAGELVLDCILVSPTEWWIGYHRAKSRTSCTPGGMSPIQSPAGTVSRAYLKMNESLAWSGLPLKEGDRCVEIGCAPGGSCQALLEREMLVTGIDPADVHPTIKEHPNFVHIRKRGADVRRREFRKTRWLMADLNVAPQYTLDTIEAIVTHPEVKIRGLLLTLKLIEWELADEIPVYLERIRSWGFPLVRARQLQHNRQEICVVALLEKPKRKRSPSEVRRKSNG